MVPKAVVTVARAENALEQWRKRGGHRTLAFCVSTRHADFMREFCRERGLRVAAVHSGPESELQAESLEKLQIVFAVDMFNEGVDLPEIDTVMMLRPTESVVLWLQQLGRGLRWREGKTLKLPSLVRARSGSELGDRDLVHLIVELITEGL